MALIPMVLDNDFKIIKDEVPTIPVMADARLTWMKYFSTVTKAKSNTSIIATIILPVADEKEAENIVQSAKISQLNSSEIEISVDALSGNYKWIFEKKEEGYSLKK